MNRRWTSSKGRARKIARESCDPYYDLFEDFDLITASLRSQYGVSVYSEDFKNMKWDEFKSLLSGIGPDTPLGRVVAIRAEDDKDIIQKFTPNQRKIWRDWRNRTAQGKSEEEISDVLESIKNAFIRLSNS